MKAQLREAKRRNGEYEDEIERLKDQLAKKNSELEKATKRIKRLEKRQDSSSSSSSEDSDQVGGMKKQLKSSQKKIKMLEGQKKDLEEDLDELRQQLGTSNKRSKGSDDSEEVGSGLSLQQKRWYQDEIARLEKTIKGLTGKKASKKGNQEEEDDSGSESFEDDAELRNIKQSIRELEKKHEREIKEEQDALAKEAEENLREKFSIVEIQLKLALESLTLQHDTSSLLKENVKCYSQLNTELSQKQDEYQEDLRMVKDSLKELQEAHHVVARSNIRSSAELEQAREKLKKAEEELKVSEERHELKLTQALDRAQEDKNREIEDLVRTKNEMADLAKKKTKEAEGYMKKCKKYKGQLKQTKKKLKNLEASMYQDGDDYEDDEDDE